MRASERGRERERARREKSRVSNETKHNWSKCYQEIFKSYLWRQRYNGAAHPTLTSLSLAFMNKCNSKLKFLAGTHIASQVFLFFFFISVNEEYSRHSFRTEFSCEFSFLRSFYFVLNLYFRKVFEEIIAGDGVFTTISFRTTTTSMTFNDVCVFIEQKNPYYV